MSQIVDCINNIDALPDMDAECVDAIVTDPPYGLGFMGKTWDKALPDPRTWAECLRVLKPGGHAVIFGAPRLYHRLAVAVEDAGFEVRDVLMWLFGQGFPKSLDVSKAIDGHLGAERLVLGPNHNCWTPRDNTVLGHGRGIQSTGINKNITAPATPEAAAWAGWGTALKPAYEPILLVRKPLSGTVAANVLTHGTGGINVDACRVGDEILPPAVSGTAGGFASYSGGAGAVTPERVGRWPANVIVDEEAGAILDWQTGLTRSSGHTRRNAGTPSVARGKHAAHMGRGHADEGGASRFFYCPKASRSEREAGLTPPEGGGRANTHPTVKPVALMEWLVKLVTPPGGLVLDPFCGSGSTGVACARLGVRFLGLEIDPAHVEVARARIAHARKS